MDLSQIKCWLLLLLACLSSVFETAASNFISDGVFGSEVLTQRRLLQTKQRCPINFEIQNYTIITSQCKPTYKSEDCCPAFKEFACPFLEDLNDLRNDCVTTMFNYIYLNKIPPGLLNSLCGQDKDGVTCPAPPPLQSETAAAADASTTARPAASLVFALLTVITFLFINFY